MSKIFIATGGTGGHIIPARCLASELSKDHNIFVLADKKYENYVKQNDRFKSVFINSAQIKKSFSGIFLGVIKIFLGGFKALILMAWHRPQFVFSFGGYTTFPTLIAAVLMRRKIILHEQNAHLGKVHRLFAKQAFKIALTFEKTDAIPQSCQEKCVVVGNLVREEILELNKKPYELPQEAVLKKRDKMGYENLILASEFDDADDFEKQKQKQNLKILVIGGSGGAAIFSEILPKAFFNLSDDIKNNIEIFQQCRFDLLESTFEQYQKFNLNIDLESFFDDMKEKIDGAHLIIARAGSSSLAEFAAAKKPMILVPFARAADDHQLKNARIYQESGCAILVEEKDFSINNIAQILTNLLGDDAALHKMSKNCDKVAKLDATLKLADLAR